MKNFIATEKWSLGENVLIHNDEQYKKHLEEIHNLMDQDPDLNTPEGERLSLLAMVVKEYEGKHFFFNKPSPEECYEECVACGELGEMPIPGEFMNCPCCQGRENIRTCRKCHGNGYE